MNRTPLVALLALVVLTGCGTPPANSAPTTQPPVHGTVDDDTPTPPEPSVESERTPTKTPTSLAGYPPGVSSTSLRNATKLADAHRAVIRKQSFAFTWAATMSMHFGNHTVSSNTTAEGSATRNLTMITLRSVERISDGNQTSVERRGRWVNQTAMVSRIDDGNQTRFFQTTRSMASGMGIEHQATGYVMILDVLRRGNYSVVDRTARDDVHFVTLRATKFTAETPTNVSQFESTLVVDERGLIHELNYTLDVIPTGDSRLSSMHYGYELTRVGSVTVERPTWATNASAVQRQTSAGGS